MYRMADPKSLFHQRHGTCEIQEREIIETSGKK